MDTLKRTDFEENFLEQFKFLVKSCNDFDAGDEVEAKRISTALRILLKDKGRNTSVLSHLNKKNIDFYSYLLPSAGVIIIGSNTNNCIINAQGGLAVGKNTSNCIIDSQDLGVYMGGVMKSLSGQSNVMSYRFEPLCTCDDSIIKGCLVCFDDWYNQEILWDPNGTMLTRKMLIETLSEQDGGVHVDAKIINEYIYFKQKTSLLLNVNGQDVVFENNAAYASMRNIAYEIIETVCRDNYLRGLLVNAGLVVTKMVEQ